MVYIFMCGVEDDGFFGFMQMQYVDDCVFVFVWCDGMSDIVDIVVLFVGVDGRQVYGVFLELFGEFCNWFGYCC